MGGLGRLDYDQGQIFIGDFLHGEMQAGVVYEYDGVEAMVKDTMQGANWNNPIDWTIVAQFPFPGQAVQLPPRSSPEQHVQQPVQREPVEIRQMETQRMQPEAVRTEVLETQAGEPFLMEGSPFTVVLVVVMFAGLAASGV